MTDTRAQGMQLSLFSQTLYSLAAGTRCDLSLYLPAIAHIIGKQETLTVN